MRPRAVAQEGHLRVIDERGLVDAEVHVAVGAYGQGRIAAVKGVEVFFAVKVLVGVMVGRNGPGQIIPRKPEGRLFLQDKDRIRPRPDRHLIPKSHPIIKRPERQVHLPLRRGLLPQTHPQLMVPVPHAVPLAPRQVPGRVPFRRDTVQHLKAAAQVGRTPQRKSQLGGQDKRAVVVVDGVVRLAVLQREGEGDLAVRGMEAVVDRGGAAGGEEEECGEVEEAAHGGKVTGSMLPFAIGVKGS